MQQITVRQAIIYGLVVVVMAAVTWWLVKMHQSGVERESILQAEKQKEAIELKKLLETLAVAQAPRKPSEPSPALEAQKDAVELNKLVQLMLKDVQRKAGDPAEQKAIAKSRLKSLEFQVQQISSVIDKAQIAMKRWETRSKSVLTSADGKRLAGDKLLASQVAALLDKYRIPKDALDSIRDKAEMLFARLRDADREGKEAVMPSDAMLKEMDGLVKSSQEALRMYEHDLEILETLVADSASHPVADKLLETVVTDIKAARNRQRAEAIAAAKNDAFVEATKKIAEAEAQLEKQRGDLEAQRLAEVGKAETVRKDYEIAKLAAARKRDELVAKYDLTIGDIKLHLAPFIANGYAQPDGPKHLKKEGKAEPMSYSRMISAGALLPNRPGLECLLFLGGSFNNDRHRGNFPKHVGGEYGWEKADKVFLQRAQDLLKEFGPIMVERKLLSP